MPLFTSDRERRLWFWALAAVIAIWSTLGLAGTLAAQLRAHNLLGVAFFGAFLVTLAVVALGSLRRYGQRHFWIVLGIATTYAMTVVRMGIPLEERTHLFEYGLLGVLIYRALSERRTQGRRVPVPALAAMLLTALLGWTDEGIQALLPSRVYDLRDVLFNALAGVMMIGASRLLETLQRVDDCRPP